MKKEQRINGLREFLEWFITPQNEKEKLKFKNIVDEHIRLKLRIPFMTEDELIYELDTQLDPYHLKFNGWDNEITLKSKPFTFDEVKQRANKFSDKWILDRDECCN